MKKLFLFAIAAALVTALVGCGDSDSAAPTSNAAPGTPEPIKKGNITATGSKVGMPEYRPAGKDMNRYNPGAAMDKNK